MALVRIYAAGATIGDYDELAHRSMMVELDAITAAFPGHPIIGLQAWPPGATWPGAAGASIIESAPSGVDPGDPSWGAVKVVAVIGVPLGKLVTAVGVNGAPKVPWLLIGAGALGLWLLLRTR